MISTSVTYRRIPAKVLLLRHLQVVGPRCAHGATTQEVVKSGPVIFYTKAYTVKPICNDRLYNKIQYMWLIQ